MYHAYPHVYHLTKLGEKCISQYMLYSHFRQLLPTVPRRLGSNREDRRSRDFVPTRDELDEYRISSCKLESDLMLFAGGRENYKKVLGLKGNLTEDDISEDVLIKARQAKIFMSELQKLESKILMNMFQSETDDECEAGNVVVDQ